MHSRGWLPVALLLAAPAPAAAARPLPGRAVIERELNNWYACNVYQECTGRRTFHRRVTSAHCVRLPPGYPNPGQILCFFSGVDTARGQRPRRFRQDCLYFKPVRRSWVAAYGPDADVCEG
jgi:hypothetical protein